MPQSAYPQDETLTNIAIMVKNKDAIADKVLPRTASMDKSKFSYFKFDDEQSFTVPDTKVGRRSQVNEVNFHGAKATDECEDFGLEHAIPSHDQGNSFSTVDPEALATEWLTNLVILDREIRVASLISDPATYGANTEVIAAADKIDNPASEVIMMLTDILDSSLIRANKLVMGQPVWTKLRQHPDIVKAIHGNSGDKGLVSKQALAELLEVDEIIVGQAIFNQAKPGQAPDYQRAWGNMLAALHTNEVQARAAGTTFGFTAQYLTRYAAKWEDRNVGLRGGTRVRAGESVKEVICASQFGYLLQEPLTP